MRYIGMPTNCLQGTLVLCKDSWLRRDPPERRNQHAQPVLTGNNCCERHRELPVRVDRNGRSDIAKGHIGPCGIALAIALVTGAHPAFVHGVCDGPTRRNAALPSRNISKRRGIPQERNPQVTFWQPHWPGAH